MEVIIKDMIQDLRVSTVALQPEEGGAIYAFHCSSCGNFQQQVGGRIAKIYPFYEPSGQVPVISTCSKCGRKYTFQTREGQVSAKTRVILHPIEDVNYFYCAYNKQRILEYTGKAITTIIDNKKRLVPFFAECPDVSCEQVYFFAELI